MVISRIAADPQLGLLADRLGEPQGVVSATGLWGSSAPLAVAHLAQRLNRTFLVVTSHFDQADDARDDIELFLNRACELFGAWEGLPGEGAAAAEVAAERTRVLLQLTGSNSIAGSPRVIVSPVQALMQPVPLPDRLQGETLALTRGAGPTRDALVAWLVERGYDRLELVESPGDFAVRGDIVDVFPPGSSQPLRIEYLGDSIDSLRLFDETSQRSSRDVESFRLPGRESASGKLAPGQFTHLFSYLPPDAVVVFDEPAEIEEIGRAVWERLARPVGMYPPEAVFRASAPLAQLHLGRFAGTAGVETVHFDVESLQRFETRAGEAIEELLRLAAGNDVVVYCDNQAEQQRFARMLDEAAAVGAERGARARIGLEIGLLHRGFRWAEHGLVLVGHHEVFHRYKQRHRIRRTRAARPVESWLDLAVGDYVVHVTHGIGRFKGMTTLRKANSNKAEEFLEIEYAGKSVLHVPVSQIDLVQKYIGAGGLRPTLSKIGGTRWTRTKEAVAEAVSDLAGEMLRLQAERESVPGTPYPADTEWQREFEESFIYTETEDQLTVAAEIKSDQMRERPMDRLLCGDVGYGKTELAMRAAFKVAEYGRQTAVLVPTTVLAEQHAQTFRERMADYPFVVESLSRFRTAAQQREILQRTRKGQVDVLIGTHRLLSKDVAFADLGLVIVDEEQRFGVEHKERLKRLRTTVDVLTLTATPIPRTLHMAMLGIRDISSLTTPPMDRRNIVTQVRPWEDDLIRDAIIREMNRDGQVFFLHNRVRGIQAVSAKIQSIVPECRILVGHGQMGVHELEDVMLRFVNREADVLVCTTIIESGIDIPNVNTIFIDNADQFGLADLHQLRGRVGRYKHRAYCYLLLPAGRTITRDAAKRLKAIEEFAELGAGFRIAMRDLEIRGAGNILGEQQSGHIAAVGYEMYCRLLESAVRRLRNEPESAPPRVHLELDVLAQIPRGYVRADRQRMEIYRRVAACTTIEELQRLEADMKDAFGPIPPAATTLLELAEIRVLCHRWRIVSIIRTPPDLIFAVQDMHLVDALFSGAAGSVRIPDAETVFWRPPPAYLEPATLLAVLRKLLGKAMPAPAAAVATGARGRYAESS